jgi:hypothetical protein
VFEPAVDCLRGAVRCSRPVEVREDVRSTLVEGPAELGDLDEPGGDTGGERVDQPGHHLPAFGPVLVTVGGDHGLVDTPGHLYFGVVVSGEEGVEAGALAVGEKIVAGEQGASGLVEGVVPPAAMPVKVLLDPSAALLPTGSPSSPATFNGTGRPTPSSPLRAGPSSGFGSTTRCRWRQRW